jgi:hypothetical protein
VLVVLWNFSAATLPKWMEEANGHFAPNRKPAADANVN